MEEDGGLGKQVMENEREFRWEIAVRKSLSWDTPSLV